METVEKQSVEAQMNDSKREPCKYFMSGRCVFGDACWFSHDVEQTGGQNYPPNGRISGFYPYFPPTVGYPFPVRWVYAPILPSKFRTKPCKFYSKGTCRYADGCRFLHVLEENGENRKEESDDVVETSSEGSQNNETQNTHIKSTEEQTCEDEKNTKNENTKNENINNVNQRNLFHSVEDIENEIKRLSLSAKDASEKGHDEKMNELLSQVKELRECIPKFNIQEWKKVQDIVNNEKPHLLKLVYVTQVTPCIFVDDKHGVGIQIGVKDASHLDKVPSHIKGIKTIAFVDHSSKGKKKKNKKKK